MAGALLEEFQKVIPFWSKNLALETFQNPEKFELNYEIYNDEDVKLTLGNVFKVLGWCKSVSRVLGNLSKSGSNTGEHNNNQNGKDENNFDVFQNIFLFQIIEFQHTHFNMQFQHKHPNTVLQKMTTSKKKITI